MDIKQHNINDLVFAEYNPRQLTKEQYKNLKDSIKRFGLVDPVIINKNKDRENIVIGGHQRLKIAKDLNIEKIPCVELDLTIDQEKELNVRLNKNTGEWDWDALANYFDVESLIDWGFTNEELQFETPEVIGQTDDDSIPEKINPRTQMGNIWLLGDHKILCGDATIKENVKLLMGKVKADMVFTDPPYGVNVKGGKQHSHIEGDLTQVAIPFSFDLAVQEATKNDARFYFCGGEGNIPLYIKLFDKYLNRLPKLLIWVKNGFVMKPNNYHQQFEIIFYGFKPKGGGLKKWYSGRKESEASDVWKINRDPSQTYLHPTQKPVELVERAIKNSCPKKGVVYDPFGGSGSTLIACEKNNKSCFMMELDPAYCDVIVQRWEDYTGKKAVLLESAVA